MEIDWIGFKLIPISLYSYLNHQNIYSYNTKYNLFVQKYCLDIFFIQIRFPDKNNLFACLNLNSDQLCQHLKTRLKARPRLEFYNENWSIFQCSCWDEDERDLQVLTEFRLFLIVSWPTKLKKLLTVFGEF